MGLLCPWSVLGGTSNLEKSGVMSVTKSLLPPLDCDTMAPALGKRKEAGGWNLPFTLSSLLQGATGMSHAKTLHPVAQMLWNELHCSDIPVPAA